jgi:NDP-sugar dehydratase or epimerase
MSKKVIILGATGKVGTYVLDYAIRFFADKDYEVIASGRRQTNFFERMNVPYYSVNLSNKEDFAILPKDDVHSVILLSAQLPTKSDGQEPRKQFDANLVGTFNVLEYCREVKADRLLFCQTVFDLAGYFGENKPLEPYAQPKFSYSDFHSLYVICKNATIELMEHYYEKYGLKKFVFRLPTIYAYNAYPYMYNDNGEKVMRPLYVMINRAINSEPLSIWGDPNYSKDMVHVYDFAQMLCKCVLVDRDKGFYNVGTGVPVTLEQQVRTIVNVFSPENNPSPISYAPEKVSGGGCLMNIDNAKEELGYKPVYNIRKLLEQFKEEMVTNRFLELRSDLRYQ